MAFHPLAVRSLGPSLPAARKEVAAPVCPELTPASEALRIARVGGREGRAAAPREDVGVQVDRQGCSGHGCSGLAYPRLSCSRQLCDELWVFFLCRIFVLWLA